MWETVPNVEPPKIIDIWVNVWKGNRNGDYVFVTFKNKEDADINSKSTIETEYTFIKTEKFTTTLD